MKTDPYYKKTVVLRQNRAELPLQVAHDLFSSHNVDAGTGLLLRSLAGHQAGKVLDLGSGYGPLGLGLKATDTSRQVHLVDRDALAVEFSRRNATENGFEDVEAYGSLGYDDVTTADFDLIVSNLPGKAGPGVIAHLLLDGRFFLNTDGVMAIVVVQALASEVKSILSGANVEILLERHNKRHAVFHYRFGEREEGYVPAFDRGVYDRAELVIGERRFPTVYGLTEFSSLSYATDLLLAELPDPSKAGSVAVLNPGQGFVPSATMDRFQPDSMLLVDRDLLALRMSQRALGLFGAPDELEVVHADHIEAAGLDVVVGMLRVKEPATYSAARLEDAARATKAGGKLCFAGTSTAVTRGIAHLEGAGLVLTASRRHKKGFSAAVLSVK